jgi:hypothetical protein
VIVPRWLPYYTILVPLAATLAKHPMPGGPAAVIAREKLVRWFWCSVFGQEYENAPNSQAAKDVAELGRWLGGGTAPAAVTEFHFDPAVLRDTTRRQRAVYSGTICLILRNGARDFHTGQLISGDLIVENHIDDHHIFPDAYLRGARPDLSARIRECVLNRTLIDRTTNQRISDRPPSQYIAEIAKEYEGAGKAADLATLLGSHFLMGDAASPLWKDDYDAFLEGRQHALWNEIRQATGYEPAFKQA